MIKEIHRLTSIILPRTGKSEVWSTLISAGTGILSILAIGWKTDNWGMGTLAGIAVTVFSDKFISLYRNDQQRSLIDTSIEQNFETHIKRMDHRQGDILRSIALLDNSMAAQGEMTSLSLEDAIRRIQIAVSTADFVFNTNVNIVDPRSSRGYSIATAYKGMLLGNPTRQWHDIIGIGEVFSDRYKNLDLDEHADGILLVTVLRHASPIINFIIISHHGYDEIYLGWVSWRPSTNDKVFYSRNTDLINLFKGYFGILVDNYGWFNEADKKTLRITKSRPISAERDIADKRGTWITSLTEDGIIIKYGVIHIDFPQGHISVHAHIYDDKFHIISETPHEKYKIAHYKNEIYFRYEESCAVNGIYEKISGFCYYNVTRLERTIVNGFTLSDQDNKKRPIKGVKVEDSPSKEYYSSDRIRDLVETHKIFLV